MLIGPTMQFRSGIYLRWSLFRGGCYKKAITWYVYLTYHSNPFHRSIPLFHSTIPLNPDAPKEEGLPHSFACQCISVVWLV